MRDRVSTVLNQLPEDAQPPVIQKFDNDSAPVVTIALSGRALAARADGDRRQDRARALERTGGVGEVRVVGGLERAINVWIDADRLAAYQIPITAVRQALALQNADVPGGNVQAEREELVLRTIGRYADPRAIADLVVANLPPGRGRAGGPGRGRHAHPHPRHRTRGGRHQGAAEPGAPERRSRP